MEIKLTPINEHDIELNIAVPWAVVQDDYNDLLKQYAKIPIKGFRQGKVPVSAIETQCRKQLATDLLTVVSTRLCRKALAEKGMVAGSSIEITDYKIRKNEDLQFSARFISMPEFELPDYENLHLQSVDKEEKLDEISSRLLEQTKISLPPSFVEKELAYTNRVGESFSESDKQAAEERVKLMLILKKIAHQNTIEVEERDVEQRINTVAADNEVTPNELKEFLIANHGLSRLTDALLAEMVLDYIIDLQS